jgi:hypothetical protein
MGLRRSREPQQTTRFGRKTSRIEQIVPVRQHGMRLPPVWVVDHFLQPVCNTIHRGGCGPGPSMLPRDRTRPYSSSVRTRSARSRSLRAEFVPLKGQAPRVAGLLLDHLLGSVQSTQRANQTLPWVGVWLFMITIYAFHFLPASNCAITAHILVSFRCRLT